MTRSGKSFKTERGALAWPGPVLFINPQGKAMEWQEQWVRTGPEDSLRSVVAYLRSNKRARVEYVPTWRRDQMIKEINVLVDSLMELEWHPDLCIVFDECDLYAPQGKRDTACHQVAQRGGKCFVWGRFVTQHASVVDKMIIRQCLRKTIFLLEDSAEYLTRHSMPGEQIERILAAAPKYSYLIWERRQLTGPFRD